jgi:hypothetical protein
LTLCNARGRFLFEVRPDIFPENMMTRTELELWSLFFEDREKRK